MPDRFLVGLAVLGLLSEMAQDRPLLCVVDDAQWLDRASSQALGFVARRLLAESVVLLFGAREPGDELRGLPELVVEGLRDVDARQLLASVIPWPLDDRVSEQIVAETRGNPLALLELPRGLTPTELADGFGWLAALSLEGRIEESFLRRLQALPEDTQRLLLVAAAEPTGDPALMWRAATRLSIAGSALESARSAGLLEVGARVRFRHPLVRSAIYRTASPQETRQAHRALAEATDAGVDPDRRAWRLAAAGSFDAALSLLAISEADVGDDLGRARIRLLRAQIAFASRRSRDAPPLLLKAARELEAVDWNLMAFPTLRSALACSSAHAQSNTTFTRSSTSSGFVHANS